MPTLLLRLSVAGFFAGILLSQPLWFPGLRTSFPTIPIFDNIPFESSFHAVKTALLPAACLFAFARVNRITIAVLLGAMALSCLYDVQCAQPWVWFYALSLSCVFIRREEDALDTLRWIFAAVYFWSGLSKLTPWFAEDNFPWFCEAFAFTHPLGETTHLAYVPALLETLFGPFLIWKKTRPYARLAVVLMHGIIIIVLLKLNWNILVVPWNLAMAATVWFLFREKGVVGLQFRAPALFAAAGPALFYIGLWPYVFSWKLYAGTQPEATLIAPAPPSFRTSESVSENPFEKIWRLKAFDERTKLTMEDWALVDTRAPLVPTRRVFDAAFKHFCQNLVHPEKMKLHILEVNPRDKSDVKETLIPYSP